MRFWRRATVVAEAQQVIKAEETCRLLCRERGSVREAIEYLWALSPGKRFAPDERKVLLEILIYWYDREKDQGGQQDRQQKGG